VVFLIGAGVALYQFNFLITQDRFSHHLRSRVLRLAVFSLIYIGLAGVNYWQYSSYSDGLLARILWNLPEMSLILFLGSLAVFDYRNQVRILERVPISSYHRLPTLPSVLEGKLLVLDIKGSERLFKQASFVPGHELVVPTLLSHLWNTIQAHGGTVLRAEGDEIIAFFESSKNNSMNVILNALVECELHLSQVTGQFPVGEYEEWADVSEIHFRAAVVSGLIKPIWIGNEKERMPGWNQVGIEMPFVDCARLLEAEKNIKIENLENRSLVIMKTAEVKDDPEGFRHKGFLFHDLIVLSKGKSTYQVSVFDPSLANEKTKDAIGSQKNKAA
jgi:hypothetical protein